MSNLQEAPGTPKLESRAFPSLHHFSTYWGSVPEGHKMADGIKIDEEIYAIKDTDLWVLVGIVDRYKVQSNNPGLTLKFLSAETGWNINTVGRILQRACKMNVLVSLNTGRGLKIYRLDKSYRENKA